MCLHMYNIASLALPDFISLFNMRCRAKWSLVFDREDRILVAKTVYGKSVVPQLLPLLTRSSIVIVLLPLNALGAEQLADIQRLPLAKPIWLSSKNNNAATLRRIRAGIFTHVLVSPDGGNRL